jgi:hypothetical protein
MVFVVFMWLVLSVSALTCWWLFATSCYRGIALQEEGVGQDLDSIQIRGWEVEGEADAVHVVERWRPQAGGAFGAAAGRG